MHFIGTAVTLFIVFFITYMICDRVTNYFRTVKQPPKYRSALVGASSSRLDYLSCNTGPLIKMTRNITFLVIFFDSTHV